MRNFEIVKTAQLEGGDLVVKDWCEEEYRAVKTTDINLVGKIEVKEILLSLFDLPSWYSNKELLKHISEQLNK